MTDIPSIPFDKIAIDLLSDLNASASGSQQLTGWQEAFLITDKIAVIIVCIFIHNYLHIQMCPCFILSGNGTEFKN